MVLSWVSLEYFVAQTHGKMIWLASFLCSIINFKSVPYPGNFWGWYTSLGTQKMRSKNLAVLSGPIYFRIQRKHQTCSKRALYLGNTSWPCSPKLMGILSISDNQSKQVIQWHILFMVYCTFMVCYNFSFHLSDFLESLVTVE